jgi:tetratricopeptide (TPR) repeat protein
MVMEDLVVRKTWLNTIAALCAVGAGGFAAEAGAAGWWWNRSETPTVTATAPSITQATRPNDDVSPMRHPIQYMASAVSGMPSPSSIWKKDATTAKAKPQRDSISLDTPTGPPTPQLLVSMGQLAERKGDVAQARKHYQQALKQWPGQVDVLRAAARMEDRLGGLQLAENLYQQAVAANPEHAGALNDLGLCLARQGKLEPSIQVIEKAVTLQPEKALYRNNAATVLIEMRQDQKALAHLAAVHGTARANYNMGQLLVQRGRTVEAAAYFVAALEMDPTMQAAQVALANLQGPMTSEAPSVASGAVAPGFTPAVGQQPSQPVAPQQAPAGPEFSFPSTASNPAWGTSSYVPRGHYAPAGQYPAGQYPQQQAVPRVSQVPPRYLPPVQGQQPQQSPVGVRRY